MLSQKQIARLSREKGNKYHTQDVADFDREWTEVTERIKKRVEWVTKKKQ